MATKLLYTIPEAADLTGIGRTTLYGEITAGRLESVKIGRARRIPADALEAFVAELRRESSGGARTDVPA